MSAARGYWPPDQMIERLAAYANEHGAKALLLTRGREHVTAGDWDALQHGWRHARGRRTSRVAFEPLRHRPCIVKTVSLPAFLQVRGLATLYPGWEPVNGFEPLTLRLQGAILPS